MFITGLPESSLPAIGTTIPSPLQYGYRTKLTPHFREPPKKAPKPEGSAKPDWLKIGFNVNDAFQVLDIEVEAVLLAYSYAELTYALGMPDRSPGFERSLWADTGKDLFVRRDCDGPRPVMLTRP